MRCDPGALARDTSDEPRDGWRLASRHESITDRRASIYLARVRRLPSKYNPYLRSTLSVRGPAHAKVPRSEFQCSVGIRGLVGTVQYDLSTSVHITACMRGRHTRVRGGFL